MLLLLCVVLEVGGKPSCLSRGSSQLCGCAAGDGEGGGAREVHTAEVLCGVEDCAAAVGEGKAGLHLTAQVYMECKVYRVHII